MKAGNFIVFEGIDGSGKGTQIELLRSRLESQGIFPGVTREPTDRPVGRLLRQYLGGELAGDEKTIAALFVADRLDHLLNEEDGIAARLKKGEDLICDRYYFSSYAYHGVRMPVDWVISANSVCADILRPTLTVFIDVDPKEAVRRLYAGRSHIEIFENEERLTEVRALYLAMFRRFEGTERVAVIDGNRDPEEIAEDVYRSVKGLFFEA